MHAMEQFQVGFSFFGVGDAILYERLEKPIERWIDNSTGQTLIHTSTVQHRNLSHVYKDYAETYHGHG
jgi:hypothetical protein